MGSRPSKGVCEFDEPLRLSSRVARDRGDMESACFREFLAALLILSVCVQRLFSVCQVKGQYTSSVSRWDVLDQHCCTMCELSGDAACGKGNFTSANLACQWSSAAIEAVLLLRSPCQELSLTSSTNNVVHFRLLIRSLANHVHALRLLLSSHSVI